MMASSEVTDDGFVRVARLSDLSKQQKICVKVQDRIVALFFAKDSVYALDLFCYRKKISSTVLIMYNDNLCHHKMHCVCKSCEI